MRRGVCLVLPWFVRLFFALETTRSRLRRTRMLASSREASTKTHAECFDSQVLEVGKRCPVSVRCVHELQYSGRLHRLERDFQCVGGSPTL